MAKFGNLTALKWLAIIKCLPTKYNFRKMIPDMMTIIEVDIIGFHHIYTWYLDNNYDKFKNNITKITYEG